jgi:hypothetical protein
MSRAPETNRRAISSDNVRRTLGLHTSRPDQISSGRALPTSASLWPSANRMASSAWHQAALEQQRRALSTAPSLARG